MLSLNRRSTVRSIAIGLVFACLLSLSAPLAAAANGPQNDKSAEREVSLTSDVPVPAPEIKLPRVLYAAFENLSAPVEPPLEAATRPRRVSMPVESLKPESMPLTVAPIPVPPRPGAVSFAPMSAKEKFEAWFRSRFMSVGALGSAAFNGMWNELNDDDDFKKDTVGNFFADSATRAARSYAFGTTASFYERALLASLFRQDPRYHRSGKTGAGARIGYAVTRVFVTQGDRGGSQFNASFLIGGAGAAVTANLWERSERTGPMRTLARWYNHVWITAFYNIIREFVSGQ